MSDSSSNTRRVAVFSDFDGTIAHPDTINLLAETFGGVEFRRDIGGKIASGEISLRDGIAAEVATIRGDLDQVLDFLRQRVEIDESFPPFAQWCRHHEIPLTVLSAGIKDVIERLSRLANLCRQKQLPFFPLEDFSTVGATITRHLIQGNGTGSPNR